MEYTINDIYKKCVVHNIKSGPFNIVHSMVWCDLTNLQMHHKIIAFKKWMFININDNCAQAMCYWGNTQHR
jgi:hypothetical protein